MTVDVRRGSAEEAHGVFLQVPEFHEKPGELFPTPADIAKRIRDKTNIILIGQVDGEAAGALVGYDKHKDGSAYAWLAGVDARFRRAGVLGTMMSEFERWALSKGFDSVELTTRNSRRAMLAFLVAHDFLFMDVDADARDPRESHIRLMKQLSAKA